MTHQGGYYDDQSATFGDRLAAAREATGMDQRALARRMGIKLATLEKWEQDMSAPRANRLSMMAGLLNVSIPWLLTGMGDGPEDTGLSSEETSILMEIRSLRAGLEDAVAQIGLLEKRLRLTMKDNE